MAKHTTQAPAQITTTSPVTKTAVTRLVEYQVVDGKIVADTNPGVLQ